MHLYERTCKFRILEAGATVWLLVSPLSNITAHGHLCMDFGKGIFLSMVIKMTEYLQWNHIFWEIFRWSNFHISLDWNNSCCIYLFFFFFCWKKFHYIWELHKAGCTVLVSEFMRVHIEHLACIYAYAYTCAHTHIQVFIIQDQCFWTPELLWFQGTM